MWRLRELGLNKRRIRRNQEICVTNGRAIVGTADYLIEKIPDVPLWNETMATFFNDPVNGMTGQLYIGRWWGEPTTLRAMIAIAMPDDRIFFVRSYGRSPDPCLPSAAGLTMRPTDHGSFDFDFDGPMDLRSQAAVSRNGFGYGTTVRGTLKLRFTASFPIWEMHQDDGGGHVSDPMSPGGHKEQLGRITGTVQLGTETIHVANAYAVRDHSRGVRNYAGHTGHVWINGQFPSGWGFLALAAAVPGSTGLGFDKAIIYQDGNEMRASMKTYGAESYASNVWQPFDVDLVCDNETRKVQVAKFRNAFPLGLINPADPHWGVPVGMPDATWALEQSVELLCDGEIGFGHVERSNRAVVIDEHWRAMFEAPSGTPEGQPPEVTIFKTD